MADTLLSWKSHTGYAVMAVCVCVVCSDGGECAIRSSGQNHTAHLLTGHVY
jgi:hypothetical protein